MNYILEGLTRCSRTVETIIHIYCDEHLIFSIINFFFSCTIYSRTFWPTFLYFFFAVTPDFVFFCFFLCANRARIMKELSHSAIGESREISAESLRSFHHCVRPRGSPSEKITNEPETNQKYIPCNRRTPRGRQIHRDVEEKRATRFSHFTYTHFHIHRHRHIRVIKFSGLLEATVLYHCVRELYRYMWGRYI